MTEILVSYFKNYESSSNCYKKKRKREIMQLNVICLSFYSLTWSDAHPATASLDPKVQVAYTGAKVGYVTQSLLHLESFTGRIMLKLITPSFLV